MAQTSQDEWSSGICDCTQDLCGCMYAFCLLPCYAASIAKEFEENPVLILCDICSPAGLSLLGMPFAVAPFALSLRTAMRRKYGIKGTLKDDIISTCFCTSCVWCQMGRELNKRKGLPTTRIQFPVTRQP